MPPALPSPRLHIGLFGRQNAGKTSLLRALARPSALARTSASPGDRVLDLPPLGSVHIVDTASPDEDGPLGDGHPTQAMLSRVHLGIIVTEAGMWTDFEQRLLASLKGRKVPVLVAFNKLDLRAPTENEQGRMEGMGAVPVAVSALTGAGLPSLREALLKLVPAEFFEHKRLVANLVPPGEVAVLVTSFGQEARKGLPAPAQLTAVRDLLGTGALALVVQEREIGNALEQLKRPPALVVAESQAFLRVVAELPRSLPVTAYAILTTRGNLAEHVRDTLRLDRLQESDAVLLAGADGLMPEGEELDRARLVRWLRQQVNPNLRFEHARGSELPADLGPFRFVIHCGDCGGNHRELLHRMHRCREAGIPFTSDGLAFAHALGILDRALSPFPNAHGVYQSRHRP